MTDDPDVTPDQEAQLRRLLADARHGEPIPVDVASRLEAVLEQLGAEGTHGVDPTPVIDLGARRRRLVGGLLVAAAAVVVAGLGIGQIVAPDDQADSSTAAASADAPQEESAGAADRALADLSAEAGALPDGPVAPEAKDSDATADDVQESTAQQYSVAPPGLDEPASANGQPPVRLTKRTFAEAVGRIRNRPGVVSTARSRTSSAQLTRSPAFICPTDAWGPGTLFAAFYDATPAVLAFRPQQGRTQTAELLQCGSGQVLRSIVLVIRR